MTATDPHAALRRTIHDAFAHSKPPKEAVAAAAPGQPGYEERDQLRVAFHGQPWQRVPAALAQLHHDTLGFFTDEGFHHYLPAWLTGALEEETDLDFFTLQALVPPAEGAGRKEFEQRAALFDKAQRAAIAAFLGHLAQAPDDFDAADLAAAQGYWK